MALDTTIRGITGTQAQVDANNNVTVTLPGPIVQAGYGRLAGKDGSPLKITATGYVETSLDSLDFFDTVDGAAINTNLWNQSVLTMTVTQSGGFINLNPTNSVAINTYAITSSIQTFFLTDCLPLHLHLRLQASLWNLPTNTVFEFGWGTVTTNATPTDGMFIRARAGVVYAVLNNGGSETEIALTPTFALPTVNATSEWVLDLYANEMRVFVDGVAWASSTTGDKGQSPAPIPVVAGSSLPAATANNRQPFFVRVFNAGTAPASSATVRLGQVSIQQRNAQFNKPFATKMVGLGRGSWQSPLTAFGQTANHANSTSPTSATLSNTAAGYTTLGGRFQFAAVAGAATDFALFGFQVPAGYQLYVSNITISCLNTVVAVATTATVLDWSVGVNASAVSLATADGAGTWAPRRIPLGLQGFIVGAAVGAAAPDIVRAFDSPLCIDGGRFLHIILQVPIGTATATEIFRGDVMISGYFE